MRRHSIHRQPLPARSGLDCYLSLNSGAISSFGDPNLDWQISPYTVFSGDLSSVESDKTGSVDTSSPSPSFIWTGAVSTASDGLGSKDL